MCKNAVEYLQRSVFTSHTQRLSMLSQISCSNARLLFELCMVIAHITARYSKINLQTKPVKWDNSVCKTTVSHHHAITAQMCPVEIVLCETKELKVEL